MTLLIKQNLIIITIKVAAVWQSLSPKVHFMNYFQTWNEAITASIQNLWSQIIAFVPSLFGALLVLIVGLILSSILSKLAHKIVELTKVDSLVHKIDGAKKMDEMGVKINISNLIAWLVKWFFIIVTLIAVVNILKLTEVSKFLQDVANYIPNVVVAVVILAIGLVVGQFVHDIVERSAKASKVTTHTAHSLSAVAKWALVVFSLMASLTQLKVAPELIQILFTGLVAMMALAFGLSFGLGGKEQASKWLEKMTMKHHQ